MSSEDRGAVKRNESRPPPAAVDDDAPLELEPDQDEERTSSGWSWSQAVTRKLNEESAHNGEGARAGSGGGEGAETIHDQSDFSAADRTGMGCEAGHMSDILRWALDSMHEPALAAADWLARDIDPEQPTATALLTNPRVTLAQVKQAKSVFKTMRIVGEKSADRRVGARMYAGAIAAGLVRHGQLVSRQSDEALKRAFQSLLDDRRMPSPLRDLAGMALCTLAEGRFRRTEKANGHRAGPSSSASSMMSLPGPSEPPPRPLTRSMPRPQQRRKRA